MKSWLITAAGIALVAGLVSWYIFGTNATTDPYRLHDEPAAGVSGGSASPAPFPRPGDHLTSEQLAMLDSPRVIEFANRLDFQEQVRKFFDEANRVPPAERQQQADELARQLGSYEAAGEVSAPEALMVRLALIQLTHTDEEAARQAAQSVIEQYRQQSEAREQARKNQPRPDFDAYKRREKAIVDEVMAMDRIPGGKSRDEYLRERLQQAREETMEPPGENKD